MSASAQGSPCPSCHALGFIPKYTPGSMLAGNLVICPDCDGRKFLPSTAADRAILGICIYCHQEINVVNGPPCLPEYPAHVIESTLPTTSLKDEVPNA